MNENSIIEFQNNGAIWGMSLRFININDLKDHDLFSDT